MKTLDATLDPRSLRLWGWILIIAGVIAQSSFIFVEREALAHRPFEEDTFFHLTVTRNMAMGKGITIDATERTSGKIIDFMLSHHLKYIADWPEQIGGYCDYAEFPRHYEPIAQIGAHKIYRLRDDTPGQVNEKVSASSGIPARNDPSQFRL